jgi:hypothetical protein
MKEALLNQYKHVDQYISVTPAVDVEGLTEFKLIKIRPGSPPMIGWLWYILFTILGVVELYKLYFAMFCVTKDFEITKVVSTRSNLNTENRFEEPRIIVFQDTYVIKQDNLVGDKAPQLPTREELEQANAYTKKLSRTGTIRMDLSAPNVPEQRHDGEEEGVPFNQQSGNYRV